MSDAVDYEQHQPYEWQCPKCTYINSKSRRSCLICEYEKTKKSAAAVDSSTMAATNSYDKYKNVLKTKLNSFGSDVKNFINGLNVAPSTSSSRQDDVIEIDPHSGRSVRGENKLWRCRSCTFSANPDWARKCEICQRRRSDASADHDVEPMEVDDDIKIYDTTLDRNVYDYARIWTCKRCTYINFEKDKR